MIQKEVFTKLIDLLKGAYTQFELSEHGFKVWYSKLKKYEQAQLVEAVDKYIEQEEWEPRSPRSITKYIDKQTKTELSDIEAHLLVVDAIRKYGRDKFKEAKAHLDSKDTDIWLAVKNTRSTGWQGACSEREHTYEKAFKQVYMAIKKRKAENEYIKTVPGNTLKQSIKPQLETTQAPVPTNTDKERELEKAYSKLHSENVFNLETYSRKLVPRIDTPLQEELQAIVTLFLKHYPKCSITENDYEVIRNRLKEGYIFQEFENVARFKAKNRELIQGEAKNQPSMLYDKEWFGVYLNQWFMDQNNEQGGIFNVTSKRK